MQNSQSKYQQINNSSQSEFGGEMWWCCGKRSKDAAGCKFSKHESKEDEDEDIEQ